MYFLWFQGLQQSSWTPSNPRPRSKIAPGGKCYTCNICNATFGTSSGLRFHSVKHGQRDFQYRCPFCNKGMNATTHLKEHLKQHGGTGFNFYCFLCDSTVEKVKDFILHVQSCKEQQSAEWASLRVDVVCLDLVHVEFVLPEISETTLSTIWKIPVQ